MPGAYDESYSYDSSTGNLASKTGLGEYNYTDTSHAQGVTGLDGETKYTYDANGNMTTRTVGTDTYALTYDVENRLVSVTRNGSKTAEYVYDSDGQLALKRDYTVSQTEPDKTLYFGKYFEAFIDADYEAPAGGGTAPDCANLYCIYLPIIIAPPPLPGQVWTMYYYAGGSRAAMQVIDHAGGTSGVYTLYADHLGSTSVTADETGLLTSALMYKAWGEIRLNTGDAPTDYRYTGQREEAELGLYFYNARWYDPALGRFTQPDSMVPNPGNPMDWDRYAYVRNNPVNYNDPTGHAVGCSGYDASRCEGKNNNLNFHLEMRKYTITPAVKFTYDEIMKNMKSEIARTIKSINSENEGALVASALWASEVGPGREWDHKSKIRQMEKNEKRDPDFQMAGTREYHYDTWSNIHYGFVGREVGFSEYALLDGAGAAQLAVDISKGSKIQPDTTVTGTRKYDQSADRTAIQIGMDLWRQYGYDLRPEDIIWTIEHSSGLITKN